MSGAEITDYVIISCLASFLGLYYYFAAQYAAGVRYYKVESALTICKNAVYRIVMYPHSDIKKARD